MTNEQAKKLLNKLLTRADITNEYGEKEDMQPYEEAVNIANEALEPGEELYRLHFGQIDYKSCEIRINKDMKEEAKKEAICHEIMHGILVHLGYNEHSQNEQFVQALANAICQGFDIKPLEKVERSDLDSLQAVRDYVKQRLNEEEINERCT